MSGWDANPWREFTTAHLLRERECRQWDLADLDAHPAGWQFAPESRALLVSTIRDLNGEISRRSQLRDRKGAPKWPERERRDVGAEIAEIKRRITVLDFVAREARFREFERRGKADVWCCCPLPDHQEQSPSFHVDEVRQVWNCFGCGRGGDLLELARHLWGEGTFMRVVDRLRDLAGLTPPEPPKPVGPGLMRPDGSTATLRIPAPRPRGYGRS